MPSWRRHSHHFFQLVFAFTLCGHHLNGKPMSQVLVKIRNEKKIHTSTGRIVFEPNSKTQSPRHRTSQNPIKFMPTTRTTRGTTANPT